jgi:hypothetical protein
MLAAKLGATGMKIPKAAWSFVDCTNTTVRGMRSEGLPALHIQGGHSHDLSDIVTTNAPYSIIMEDAADISVQRLRYYSGRGRSRKYIRGHRFLTAPVAQTYRCRSPFDVYLLSTTSRQALALGVTMSKNEDGQKSPIKATAIYAVRSQRLRADDISALGAHVGVHLEDSDDAIITKLVLVTSEEMEVPPEIVQPFITSIRALGQAADAKAIREAGTKTGPVEYYRNRELIT